MKNAFAMSLVAMMGLAAATAEARTPAREEAISLAHDLVDALDDVQDLAAYLGERAERRGQHGDAHGYANLVDSAQALEQKVARQVLIPLYDGETFQYVKAQLARIKSAFDLLAYDVDELGMIPYQLADLLDEVDEIKYDLTAVLNAGDRGRGGRDDRIVTSDGRGSASR